MVEEFIDKKAQWIEGIRSHSTLLSDFMTVGLSKRDSRTQRWEGFSMLGEVNNFLKGNPSKVQADVRLWKKDASLVLHFPGIVFRIIPRIWSRGPFLELRIDLIVEYFANLALPFGYIRYQIEQLKYIPVPQSGRGFRWQFTREFNMSLCVELPLKFHTPRRSTAHRPRLARASAFFCPSVTQRGMVGSASIGWHAGGQSSRIPVFLGYSYLMTLFG